MGETTFTRRVAMAGFGAACLSVLVDRSKNKVSPGRESGEIFSPIDGQSQTTTTLDPAALDPDLNLANALVKEIATIEQTSRVPWFIVASYHTHILNLNGVEPNNRDPKLIGFTRDAMNNVGQRVFNSPENPAGVSLYASLEQELINRGRPFSTDSVLGHALVLRQRFIDTERADVSSGKLPDSLVEVHGINVHTSIAEDLKALLDQAKNDGFSFGGWGARTTNTQIHARIKNGCGDPLNVTEIFKSKASKCNVPTAQPGLSMHERGLAVDFTAPNKDGLHEIVKRGSKEDKYLLANAPKHGLINLPSEAWHYSINGR